MLLALLLIALLLASPSSNHKHVTPERTPKQLYRPRAHIKMYHQVRSLSTAGSPPAPASDSRVTRRAFWPWKSGALSSPPAEARKGWPTAACGAWPVTAPTRIAPNWRASRCWSDRCHAVTLSHYHSVIQHAVMSPCHASHCDAGQRVTRRTRFCPFERFDDQPSKFCQFSIGIKYIDFVYSWWLLPVIVNWFILNFFEFLNFFNWLYYIYLETTKNNWRMKGITHIQKLFDMIGLYVS